MTPEQRKAQADEWRWLRRQSAAGARRAWRADRNWIRDVLRKSQDTSRLGELLGRMPAAK